MILDVLGTSPAPSPGSSTAAAGDAAPEPRAATAPDGDWVVGCGSLPPGMPDAFYAQLAARVARTVASAAAVHTTRVPARPMPTMISLLGP